jgi:Methyltransferase domain
MIRSSLTLRRPTQRPGGRILLFSLVCVAFTLAVIYMSASSVQTDTGSPPLASFLSPSTSLAYQDSNGFFVDVLDTAWKLQREKARTKTHYFDNNAPLRNANSAGYWYANNLQPYLSCPNAERIGGPEDNGHGDGPKWVCNPQSVTNKKQFRQAVRGISPSSDAAAAAADEPCLIYSIGCNGQYDFEDALCARSDRTCEIHIFDPANYVRPGDVENKNIHFHQWGLISSNLVQSRQKNGLKYPDERGNTFKSFQQTMQELGHVGRKIDILKIDCESCEYETQVDWIDIDIRQILIEVHAAPTSIYPETYPGVKYNVTDFFNAFHQNYYAMFYKEPNPLYAKAVEFSFIKMNPSFWGDNSAMFRYSGPGSGRVGQ